MTPNLALDQSCIAAPVAVAYSGGADSTALLLLCARQFPGQVRALHIHHGLQAAADDFEAHCQAFCQRLHVPLQVRRVNAKHSTGQSPEDAARQARYAALLTALEEQNTQLAQIKTAQEAIKNIAIAQHADDQVETLLLALSRGAGAAGLAGMPARWEQGGVSWWRPLLQISAQDIRAWLAAQGLQARHPDDPNLGQGWVQDPSNTHTGYTRNKIRHQVLPALAQAFPQHQNTFARSMRHMAQATLLLQDLAAQDLQATGNPPAIKALQTFSRARQANALRHWLKTAHCAVGSEAQMNELLDQVAACTTRGHGIHIKLATGFVQRQGGVLGYSGAGAQG